MEKRTHSGGKERVVGSWREERGERRERGGEGRGESE
jgi:hypothetical protein